MIPDETIDDPDTESIGFCRKMTTHLDGDVLTPVGAFSKREAVEEEHVVEIEIEESLQPCKKLVMDSPTGTDIVGTEDQNNDDDVHEIWLEELLQPDIQLIDTEVDTEILCTTAELEVIDNMMYTELVNDERKIGTPIYQPGSKI